jgi:hypothetical protein
VLVKNSAGKDMLNPSTPGFLTSSEMKLYQVYNDGSKHLSMEYIETQEGNHAVSDALRYSGMIFVNLPTIQTDTTVSLLEFTNIATDTLVCRYSTGNMIGIKLNKEDVWNADSQKPRIVEIIVDR